VDGAEECARDAECEIAAASTNGHTVAASAASTSVAAACIDATHSTDDDKASTVASDGVVASADK
jgi:hypothetical protein